jgi:hypothetical protein
MKNTLLMSVAAIALIAGAGLASAQGMNQGREAPSPGPAAQQGAPPGKMGPALKETTGQPSPESKAADDAKPGQKASEPKAGIKKEKGAQTPAPAAKPTTTQAPIPDSKSNATTSQAPASDKSKSTTGASDTGKSQGTTSQSQSTTTKKTIGGSAATTSVSLSNEQRSTIRTVIKQQNVQRATNVNFSISVGARVPRTVHFYTVPVELVHIYPQWRGYDYFLVGDQIIVVDPRTHEIVAVLDA